MNLSEIRQKYPQYNDLSDGELASSFHSKFYSDIPYDDFTKQIGLTKSGPLDTMDARAARPQSMNTQRSIVMPPRVPAAGEAFAGDPFTRFALGVGKPVVGAAQLLAELALPGTAPREAAKKYIFDPLLESFKRSEQIGNPEGKFNAMGLAGEVMSPVGLSINKAINPVKGAWNRIRQGSILGGVYSATQPVTEGDFPTEKAGQIGVGVGLGAAIPGGIELVKFFGRPVSELLKAFLPGGAERLATKYTNEIVGPDNLQKIVADIGRQLPSVGKGNVPGYKPTVGELAAHMPESSPLLALQKGTGTTARGISAQFGQRASEQRQALESAMRPIAGTTQELEQALKTASENAAENYGRVMPMRVSPQSDVQLMKEAIADRFGSKANALQQAGQFATSKAENISRAGSWTPVPGMPRFPGRYSEFPQRASEAGVAAGETKGIAAFRARQQDSLERTLDVLRDTGRITDESLLPLMERPSVKYALQNAAEAAAERGGKFPASATEQFSVQNLHDAKLALDHLIRQGSVKNAPTSLSESTLQRVASTRSQFLSFLENKVPDYGKARTQFSKDMTPVNRMTVGQALEKKLFSPADQMNPGAYLRMIEDEPKTIKNVLGQPRSDFGHVFDPRQQATIEEIGNLLERKLLSTKPAQPTLLQGKDIASDATASLPSILSRPVVIANWILKTLTSGHSSLEAKVDSINAVRLLNPDKFVEAMKEVPAPQRKQIMDALAQKHGVTFTGQGLIAPSVTGLLGE